MQELIINIITWHWTPLTTIFVLHYGNRNFVYTNSRIRQEIVSVYRVPQNWGPTRNMRIPHANRNREVLYYFASWGSVFEILTIKRIPHKDKIYFILHCYINFKHWSIFFLTLMICYVLSLGSLTFRVWRGELSVSQNLFSSDNFVNLEIKPILYCFFFV